MKIKYYNTNTKEFTDNHNDAMEWYRDNITVELIDNETGEIRCHWIPFNGEDEPEAVAVPVQ